MENPRSQFLFGVQLPAEINHLILEFAVGGSLSDGCFFSLMPAKWRLISRIWNEYATPFVYNSFSFHGSRNRIHLLWKFLHAVVTRPDRAAMVRQLELTTIRINEEFSIHNNLRFQVLRIVRGYVVYPQADRETVRHIRAQYSQGNCRLHPEHSERIKSWYYRKLYKDNQTWFDQAMTDVGFDKGPHDLKAIAGRLLDQDNASDDYHCSLYALLVAYCPNLRWLTIHNHQPMMDPWLGRVLGYAIGKHADLLCLDHVPMQMVTVLRVAPRLPVMDRSRLADVLTAYRCVISEEYHPYHRLPRLKHLVGCGMIFSPPVGHIKDPEQNPSKIESLFLFGTGIRGLRLRGLLRLSPKLRKFALHLPGDYYTTSGRFETNDASFILSLWSMLDSFKDQLEYLDIRYDRLKPRTFNSWFRAGTSFCCPLAQFPQLRQLSIPIFLIIGHNCQHTGSLALCNHLPPNIVTLGLYTANMNRECFETFKLEHDLFLRHVSKNPSCPLPAIAFDHGIDMWQLCRLEGNFVVGEYLV